MPTFRISTWETEFKRCFIDAETQKDAEKIASQSLQGERTYISWDVFDREFGTLELIEEV